MGRGRYWRPKYKHRCEKCGWTGVRSLWARKCPSCGFWHPKPVGPTHRSRDKPSFPLTQGVPPVPKKSTAKRAARKSAATGGPKYPTVRVRLSGQDGNAFFILARCARAARDEGVPQSEIDAFHGEATSGDYDNLLRVCMKWFNCS